MVEQATPAAVLLAVMLAAFPAAMPAGAAAAVDPPVLVVEGPESLAGVVRQTRELDAGRLASIMQLTGLTHAGEPIRVLLAPETAVVAHDTPPWVAAFADATADLVVLFPARIGSYPYSSLETVLFHEVAHILIARASGGGRIPRWFNEGLASAAERTWGLGARSRFAWEVVAGGRPSATALEGLFFGSDRDVVRAYALSDALVRDVLERYGSDAPARILARMADGAPFEVALYAVTGYPVEGVMLSFWARHDTWKSWISAAGHPFTQWSLITLLALAAIWSQRRRRRERRRRWELEEQAEQDEWEEHRRRYRIH